MPTPIPTLLAADPTSTVERLLELVNPDPIEAARRAQEATEAFARERGVLVTEVVRGDGWTYGRVRPVVQGRR